MINERESLRDPFRCDDRMKSKKKAVAKIINTPHSLDDFFKNEKEKKEKSNLEFGSQSQSIATKSTAEVFGVRTKKKSPRDRKGNNYGAAIPKMEREKKMKPETKRKTWIGAMQSIHIPGQTWQPDVGWIPGINLDGRTSNMNGSSTSKKEHSSVEPYHKNTFIAKIEKRKDFYDENDTPAIAEPSQSLSQTIDGNSSPATPQTIRDKQKSRNKNTVITRVPQHHQNKFKSNKLTKRQSTQHAPMNPKLKFSSKLLPKSSIVSNSISNREHLVLSKLNKENIDVEQNKPKRQDKSLLESHNVSVNTIGRHHLPAAIKEKSNFEEIHCSASIDSNILSLPSDERNYILNIKEEKDSNSKQTTNHNINDPSALPSDEVNKQPIQSKIYNIVDTSNFLTLRSKSSADYSDAGSAPSDEASFRKRCSILITPPVSIKIHQDIVKKNAHSDHEKPLEQNYDNESNLQVQRSGKSSSRPTNKKSQEKCETRQRCYNEEQYLHDESKRSLTQTNEQNVNNIIELQKYPNFDDTQDKFVQNEDDQGRKIKLTNLDKEKVLDDIQNHEKDLNYKRDLRKKNNFDEHKKKKDSQSQKKHVKNQNMERDIVSSDFDNLQMKQNEKTKIEIQNSKQEAKTSHKENKHVIIKMEIQKENSDISELVLPTEIVDSIDKEHDALSQKLSKLTLRIEEIVLAQEKQEKINQSIKEQEMQCNRYNNTKTPPSPILKISPQKKMESHPSPRRVHFDAISYVKGQKSRPGNDLDTQNPHKNVKRKRKTPKRMEKNDGNITNFAISSCQSNTDYSNSASSLKSENEICQVEENMQSLGDHQELVSENNHAVKRSETLSTSIKDNHEKPDIALQMNSEEKFQPHERNDVDASSSKMSQTLHSNDVSKNERVQCDNFLSQQKVIYNGSVFKRHSSIVGDTYARSSLAHTLKGTAKTCNTKNTNFKIRKQSISLTNLFESPKKKVSKNKSCSPKEDKVENMVKSDPTFLTDQASQFPKFDFHTELRERDKKLFIENNNSWESFPSTIIGQQFIEDRGTNEGSAIFVSFDSFSDKFVSFDAFDEHDKLAKVELGDDAVNAKYDNDQSFGNEKSQPFFPLESEFVSSKENKNKYGSSKFIDPKYVHTSRDKNWNKKIQAIQPSSRGMNLADKDKSDITTKSPLQIKYTQESRLNQTDKSGWTNFSAKEKKVTFERVTYKDTIPKLKSIVQGYGKSVNRSEGAKEHECKEGDVKSSSECNSKHQVPFSSRLDQLGNLPIVGRLANPILNASRKQHIMDLKQKSGEKRLTSICGSQCFAIEEEDDKLCGVEPCSLTHFENLFEEAKLQRQQRGKPLHMTNIPLSAPLNKSDKSGPRRTKPNRKLWKTRESSKKHESIQYISKKDVELLQMANSMSFEDWEHKFANLKESNEKLFSKEEVASQTVEEMIAVLSFAQSSGSMNGLESDVDDWKQRKLKIQNMVDEVSSTSSLSHNRKRTIGKSLRQISSVAEHVLNTDSDLKLEKIQNVHEQQYKEIRSLDQSIPGNDHNVKQEQYNEQKERWIERKEKIVDAINRLNTGSKYRS